MSNWLYNNSEILSMEDMPSNTFGFIYRIECLKTGKYYIGRKNLYSKTKKKLNKKELAALPIQRGRKQTKKEVIAPSNWVEYYGSNKQLLEDIKLRGKQDFKREILMFCKTKKQLTFFEIYYQCVYDVLRKDTYNSNVSGKFFREDLV